MIDIHPLVVAKFKLSKLTLRAAAKQIRISAPSLRSMLRGESTPNSRTLKKWKHWLGADLVLQAGEHAARLRRSSKVVNDELAVRVADAPKKHRTAIAAVLQI